jgi:hypothetical protein
MKEICGCGGDEIEDFRRMGIDGLYAEEHSRPHIDIANCDTLGDGGLGIGESAFKRHGARIPFVFGE